MTDSDSEFERWKQALPSPESLPLPQQAHVLLHGLRKMVEFSDSRILYVIAGEHEKTDYQYAVAFAFYRMHLWAAAMVRLDDARDFQVSQSGSRAMFELRIDLELLKMLPGAIAEYVAFVEVERYRAAKKLVAFFEDNPNIDQSGHAAEIAYIGNPANTTKVEALVESHWGRDRKGMLHRPTHWTNLDLYGRCQKLGPEFERMYLTEYPLASWYAHPGGVGIWGISEENIVRAFALGIASGKAHFVAGMIRAAEQFPVFTADPKLRDELNWAAVADGEELVRLLIESQKK